MTLFFPLDFSFLLTLLSCWLFFHAASPFFPSLFFWWLFFPLDFSFLLTLLSYWPSFLIDSSSMLTLFSYRLSFFIIQIFFSLPLFPFLFSVLLSICITNVLSLLDGFPFLPTFLSCRLSFLAVSPSLVTLFSS